MPLAGKCHPLQLVSLRHWTWSIETKETAAADVQNSDCDVMSALPVQSTLILAL